MSTNLMILIGITGVGLIGLIVSAFNKNQDVFLFSVFLFVAGSLSIGVLLTL